MDFVTKSFRKDETLTSLTLLQHICPNFWAWLLLYSAIRPKSEDKYIVKVFNWSEFHLSEMTLLQNPYFSYLPPPYFQTILLPWLLVFCHLIEFLSTNLNWAIWHTSRNQWMHFALYFEGTFHKWRHKFLLSFLTLNPPCHQFFKTQVCKKNVQ